MCGRKQREFLKGNKDFKASKFMTNFSCFRSLCFHKHNWTTCLESGLGMAVWDKENGISILSCPNWGGVGKPLIEFGMGLKIFLKPEQVQDAVRFTHI